MLRKYLGIKFRPIAGDAKKKKQTQVKILTHIALVHTCQIAQLIPDHTLTDSTTTTTKHLILKESHKTIQVSARTRKLDRLVDKLFQMPSNKLETAEKAWAVTNVAYMDLLKSAMGYSCC